MCSASSSTISGSRAVVSGGRYARTCSRKFMGLAERSDSGDTLERVEQLAPVPALLAEDFPARRRQLVIAAPALARLLDPFPLDPRAPLHAIEHWIQRRDVEPQHGAGAVVDQLRDLVPVTAASLEGGQHHQLRRAALQVVFRGHIVRDNI